MPPLSLFQFAEAFSDPTQAEALIPWLLNLDENQDGFLEKGELRDPSGRLRCDFRVQGMGAAAWRELEKILVGRSWVEKSPRVCRTGESQGPPSRRPVASAGLFRGADHDMVFQLGKGIELSSILDFLRDAGIGARSRKNFFEASLPSGRMLRLEVSASGALQKIHYLDAGGQTSWLCRLEFWELLRSAGRLESFFADNPYYAQEREAWERYHSVVYTARSTPTLSLREASEKNWKGVLLFPDRHGSWERFLAVEKLVREEKLDWLALEMLPNSMQPELDDFLTAKSNSPAWREAKRKLQNYLQPFWSSYFKKRKDPDGNPYYRLLLLCRRRGLKIHALDARITYTLAADRKTSPLSIGTRNKVWAERIPDTGRGIVYGGEFHFTGYAKVRVQDFLWERNSRREIRLVEFEAGGR